MKANRKFVEEKEAVSAVIGVILMVAITVAIAATVYYYVTTLATTEGGSSPTISWSVDTANDQITITKCTPTDTVYASAATSANLVLKTGGTEYYIKTGAIKWAESGETSCDTSVVAAGDVIGINTTGTYTVVWDPTNEVLGSFTV